jgi:hypothetical protein
VKVLALLGSDESSAVQQSDEQTRLQVLAFRKMLKTLATREEVRDLHLHAKGDLAHDTAENETAKTEDQAAEIKEEETPEGRTVLTLYGSAPGPKQLFSSLQQPVRVSSLDGQNTPGLDTSIKVTLPLRESTLPNIISTTQVLPLPEDIDVTKKKKVATFGELYRAPAHLPQLSPPKLAKPLTTKGSTITFAPADSLPKSRRKASESYTDAAQQVGSWLGYGGVDMPKDPTSPTAKQKSRQRALSTGEAQLPPSEVSLAAVQQAKEDALFRSVYSSFAPSRDDALAIIPEEIKSKIWWNKVGEKRFNDTFPIDPALLALDDTADADVDGIEEEDFKDAVDNFTPAEADPFPKEKSPLDKNTEEILEEISELLATLASHQRIRNSSLATNPRTPIIQNSSLASLAGSPSTPSTEEFDVYQMLKSQLTLMISTLPPYAVAKLNGDQLEELNISRTIIIETADHKGVLEDDHLSRLAKSSAMPAAVGPPTLSRMTSTGSGTHSHYPPAVGAQYPRSTPSAHVPSARPMSNSQSYFPQQQSVHRSPSVHYQRTSSSQSQPYQTPATAYSNNTPRQSYPATQAYGQQTPRTGYAQALPAQSYYPAQRPSATSGYGGTSSSQYYQSSPQVQAPNRYPQQQSQNGYYQRPQNVAPMQSYNSAQSPHGRTQSPLKTGGAPINHTGYGGSRSAYGTPVAGGQVRGNYYGQSQYGTPQTHAPAAQAPVGFSSISSNHQQMMLERQQTQQSQARLAAQNSFNARQGSGTPQPPNPQYNGQPPVNGTSMVA